MWYNLKKCPFCGGEAVVIAALDDKYYVHCDGECGIRMGYWMDDRRHISHGKFEMLEEAVERWNTRI